MKVNDVFEGISNINGIKYAEITAWSSLAPLPMGDSKQYTRFHKQMEELQLSPEQYSKLQKLKRKYRGLGF